MASESLILLVSATLLLSYISSLIYEKTKVPDIIWLMSLGLTVGPLLHIFNRALFVSLAPLMSIVALSVILFEAGINLNINTMLSYMGKSIVLASLSLLTVMFVVGLTLSFLLPSEFNLLQGMLLGAMVGGTSTVSTFAVLSGLERRVKSLESTRVLLAMESIVSDPLCIIASITLIRMVMLPEFSLTESAVNILITFIFSSVYGLFAGLIWAKILDRLRNGSFTYMVTLAVLIPTYIIGERYIGGGGGAMSSLTFGLAISNHGYISKRLGLESKAHVDRERLREFHEEITFFIKSFFFVYIGMVVNLTLKYFFIGLGLTLLLMASRNTLVALIGGPLRFSALEKEVAKHIFAMGLPAFVMSQLPLIYDPLGRFFQDASVYPDLCMPIVLGTVIYGSIVAPTLVKRGLHENTVDEAGSRPVEDIIIA